MAFITTTAASISSGGTINGDLTIEGDLTVNGDGAGNYDEIINGNLVLSSGSKLGIGIGDADPATELEVVSSDRTSVRIKGTLTSDGVVSDIQFFNASDSVGAINMNRVSNNDQADMTFHTQPNSGSVTERMRIDSAGKVGIGEASPDRMLEIAGAHISAKGLLHLDSTDHSFIALDAHSSSHDSGIYFQENGTTQMIIDHDGSDNRMRFHDGSSTFMTLTSGGLLGIGNSSPVDLLHVGAGADSPAVDSVAIFTHTGTTNVAIRDASSDVELLNYAYSGGGLIGTVTNHDLSIRTNNTNRLTITSGGNISINDSSSIKQLNVLDTDNAAGRFTRSTASATTGHLSDAFVVRGKTGGDMADGFGTMIAFEINDSANSDNSIGGCGMMRDGADNSGKFFIANNNAGTYATNFYVDKTGKVGIKNDSPATALDIKGTDNTSSKITLSNTATSPDNTWSIHANYNSQALAITGDSAEVMTLLDTGLVGIGVSPDTTMHIHKATAGSVDSNANAVLTIENNTHAGIQFLTPNNANNIIYFGDADDNDISYLGYLHGSNEFEAFINGGVRLKLDANSRISLSNNDSGASNTVFGKLAGNALASGGNYNLLMGEDAGNDLTTSDHNVAIGFQALSKATANLDGNTAVGNYAMGSVVSNDVNNCTALGYASMSVGVLETTASGTVAVGFSSLNNLTSGAGNTAIGYTALTSCTSGGSNIAIGDTALEDLVTGGANVAIGRNAGKEMGAAENGNILIGMAAGQSLDEGTNGTIDSNIAIGKDSFTGGNLNTSSTAITGNIAIGTDALNSTGTNAQTGTIAIGYQSLTALTSGVGNVAIGYASADALTTGQYNTAIGYNSLSAEVTAGTAVAIGYEALALQNKGDTNNTENVGIGFQAGLRNVTGTGNTSVGFEAMKGASGQSNSNNVAIGKKALLSVTTGSNNTVVGRLAADAITSGGSNIVIGDSALGAATTATANVVIGGDAMSGVPSGQAIANVVAIGTNAFVGTADTTTGADGTVAIGKDSLKALTTGANNTAVGNLSSDALTTGSQNTAIGDSALGTSVDGVSNTALGAYAMSGGDAANYNTAIGCQSLADVTGSSNTALGHQAGNTSSNDITSGNQNTLIGAFSVASSATAENQTAIGCQATGQADNSVTLGNASVTAVYMAQDSGAVVHAAGLKFDDDQTNNIDEANTLDDYEEGYFTGALTCGSGTATVNGSYDQLAYTKIGRMVHVQGALVMSAISSPSGTLAVNLPFTSGTLTEAADFVTGVASYTGVNALKSASLLGVRIGQGSGTASLVEFTTTSEDGSDAADNITASTQIYFGFSYMV